MFLIRVVIVRQYLRSAVCAVVPPSGREHATWVEFVCVSDSLVHLQCAHLFPLPSWLVAAAVGNKDKALDANGEDIMALYDGPSQPGGVSREEVYHLNQVVCHHNLGGVSSH